ncbi:MAG TPA: UDP-N-acetylmuramoyl-L-alanyl-D-glutamate--2,6-diaminopimelate ligase, partial [Pirellulales bacterium]
MANPFLTQFALTETRKSPQSAATLGDPHRPSSLPIDSHPHVGRQDRRPPSGSSHYGDAESLGGAGQGGLAMMPALTPRTHSVSLKRLCPTARFFGSADIEVDSVAADSRAVEPGDLFAALVGNNTDGHDHIAEALARGASAVLAERFVPTGGRPLCVVPDSRVTFARVCQALADNPSRRLKVIGVTGTNGKTSTTWLIRGILEAAGYRAGLLGTLEYSDGQTAEASDLTTPPAPVLAHWLRRMEIAGCTHAVIEVSSHALAQARIEGIELNAACVTNVRRDHLDFHNTLANYRRAKAQILKHLAADGFAVFNADDAVAASFLENFDGPALTVGIRSPAEVTAQVIERFQSEQTFLLTAGQDTVPVRTRMIGDHHVANCLMAAAIGLVYGIDLADIARGIEHVEQVPGRMERIDCGQSFGVFVDYAHTPDALEGCLATLREVTYVRLICVFGAGGERDPEKRPLMGRVVETGADLPIVTDDNPRREDAAKIRHEIVRGFKWPSGARVIADRAEAIAFAL